MLEKADVWEVFHPSQLGSNIQEVVATAECKVFRMDDASGEGTMTLYRVFDGVFLMYNDFHMKNCYSQFSCDNSLLCIDHCREGRIEHRTDNGMLYYMEPGDMRVDRRVHHTGDMDFPLCHYHGITIGFQVDTAQKAIQKAIPAISIDIEGLANKYSNDAHPFVLRQDSSVEHIFSELYNVPSKIRMDYFKIKVMELLIYLAALELSEHQDERPYFYSSQIEKIKAIHTLLTADLTKNYTAEDLSNRFDISASALKNGFKSVYGSPLYTYIRTYKMNSAASMLKQDKNTRIIDVAAKVGYDNPSKFSAAFRKTMGMTPVQYRNHIR